VEFDEYVAARGTALLRFARVLAGDQASAEDLLQAALADAYARWPRVQGADHPDAYLRRVIVNRHLSWRRRRSASELVLSSEAIAASADGLPDIAAGVVDRDQVRQVLASLPARARTILVLRYYQDLGDAEIADLLGVRPATVRSTASRALSLLRDRIGAEPVPGVPHD
jgi:RNA polymerase sigma-70 factor (sigma-E family)